MSARMFSRNAKYAPGTLFARRSTGYAVLAGVAQG